MLNRDPERAIAFRRAPQELASMSLWFVFALMTAAAIFAVLLPLGLGKAAKTGGNEAAVYRDQLAEIDRDAATGLVGPARPRLRGWRLAGACLPSPIRRGGRRQSRT